jgi:ribosomal protein S18 acetylase RimI-like enzyme
MEIVKAATNDLHALAKFARLTYEQAYGKEIEPTALSLHLKDNMSDETFKEILKVDHVYLAINRGRIGGFAQVGCVDFGYAEHLEDFDQNGSELRRLYVKHELQRRGIGSALLSIAIKEFARTVYLTTWETNFDAQLFYAKHGFEKIGQIPQYSVDGVLNGYEYLMIRKS